MKKIALAILPLVLCAITCGCATQRSWRYTAEPKVIREPIINKTVAVTPFKDNRPDLNKNALMMYMVPLVPYGWAEYSAPENGGMKLNSPPFWQFKPTEDLAKAAALELEASGIFKEVFYTERASEGDLVYTGSINSTNYSGKMISYGLSVYGPCLWFICFPAGTVHNYLDVDLSLTDNSNKDLIWSNSYKREYHKSPFILYSMPSDFNYDIMYKEIMIEALQDIENKIK